MWDALQAGQRFTQDRLSVAPEAAGCVGFHRSTGDWFPRRHMAPDSLLARPRTGVFSQITRARRPLLPTKSVPTNAMKCQNGHGR